MSESNIRNRYLFYITTIVILAIICIIVFIGFWFEYTIFKPRRIAEHIDKSIESLYKKCPPDMKDVEWESAVVWTGHISANSWLMNADLNDLQHFQNELDERILMKVDMNLIFWIWDEIAKMTPSGQRYKQKYQNIMLNEMQQRANGTLNIIYR
jgi:hypothetical protein